VKCFTIGVIPKTRDIWRSARFGGPRSCPGIDWDSCRAGEVLLSGPHATILRTSSGNGRCKPLASSHGAHPDVALFVSGFRRSSVSSTATP
jgi:hypothetical protein